MKNFFNWVVEEEGVDFFYETSVYYDAKEVEGWLRLACSSMYMAACGFEEHKRHAEHFTQRARNAMVPVWNWYHDYYDTFGPDGEAEELWRIALDCQYDDEKLGYLAIVFNTMSMWWKEVWETGKDDNA